MSLITKKRILIILIIIILLASYVTYNYILKSFDEKFEILDLSKVNSINDPVLKTAIEATEECNKIKTVHENENYPYKYGCYQHIAWSIGKDYGIISCEKLNEKFKLICYQGYGRKIGEEYSPDIKAIQEACSKTDFYEECLLDAIIPIGKESSKHIETEQCQGFEQENIKQRCYEGIGRQLATDNKEQSLCKKVKNEEACLLGFAYVTDNKDKREKALQICKQLNEEYAKKCYSRIGGHSIAVYNKTIKESFKDCEQYPYPEDCKQGVARGVAIKFFSENQQGNEETIPAVTPIIFRVYKPIKLTTTKINLTVKQQIIPHFINYKLTYLQIILASLGLIIIICILKNKKVQKKIKRCYKCLKVIIRDLLIIDKTTIADFFKELKSELKSKKK